MTTGGLLVIVVALGFTLAGWLLAMFTRHQVKVHIATRDKVVTSVSSGEGSSAFDLDLTGPLSVEAREYPMSAIPTGRVIVRSPRGRRPTIVHEG